ncbi:hypothetical protein D3C81_1825140 [compost metagenome]
MHTRMRNRVFHRPTGRWDIIGSGFVVEAKAPLREPRTKLIVNLIADLTFPLLPVRLTPAGDLRTQFCQFLICFCMRPGGTNRHHPAIPQHQHHSSPFPHRDTSLFCERYNPAVLTWLAAKPRFTSLLPRYVLIAANGG